MNNKFFSVAAAILAGSFLLVSYASATSATEEYDEDAFGPQDPIVWDEPAKAVFDHKIHTDDYGLECDSCHEDLFAMEQGIAPESGNFTMAAMAEGQFCGACHDGDTAFASNTNCSACHIVPNDPIVWTKPVKAVVFYHKAHTEDYGLDCDSCHNDAFAMKAGAAENAPDFTMKALYNGQYCGACHDGETAFASNTLCNTCHIGKKGYDRMMGVDPHAEKNGAAHDGH